MKGIIKKVLLTTTMVAVICAMSVVAMATSFHVYQTGSGVGDHYTDNIGFSGSKTSIKGYCSSATNYSTVTIVVPGAKTWTISQGQTHTFNRSATAGSITCNVSLNPYTSGVESAKGTLK